jgi:hypothetical protein
MVWLCKKHRDSTRVTVLSDMDAVSASHQVEAAGVDYFLEALRAHSDVETKIVEPPSEDQAAGMLVVYI